MIQRNMTATMVCLLVACNDTPARQPAECVSLPERVRAQADHTRDPAAEVAGCRSFGADGCSACCTPTSSGGGQVADCLELDARGERLLGKPCPSTCEPCADCTLGMEEALRGFAEQTDCTCAAARDTFGCDPADDCECYCMNLEIAARFCSHLVCM